MVDLNSIPNAPMKIVFLVHFILATWGIQGHWSPDSYFFYNLIFFALIIWAIHCNESTEALQLAIVVNAASLLLDIIVLTIYFPTTSSGSERFSVGMAILNLVVRPVTVLVLYRTFLERSGGNNLHTPFPNNFGEIFSGAGGQRTYEDIDNHQSVPRTEAVSPIHYSPSNPENKMPPPYHG